MMLHVELECSLSLEEDKLYSSVGAEEGLRNTCETLALPAFGPNTPLVVANRRTASHTRLES